MTEFMDEEGDFHELNYLTFILTEYHSLQSAKERHFH